MKYVFKTVTALFFSALASISMAASLDSKLDKLLDLSGTTKQAVGAPELIKMGLTQGAQQGGGIPEEVLTKLTDAVDKTIDPQLLLSEIKDSLKKEMSESEVETLLEWYSSDLGKKITAVEEYAATPEGTQKMMASMGSLQGNSERMEIAKRLDVLLRGTEMVMEMQEFTSVAVYSAMMTAMAPNQPLNLDVFRKTVAENTPQVKQQVQQMIQVSLVYTYQSIDDKNLAAYESFLNKQLTKKFNKAGSDGLVIGFEKVLNNWTNEFSKSSTAASN